MMLDHHFSESAGGGSPAVLPMEYAKEASYEKAMLHTPTSSRSPSKLSESFGGRTLEDEDTCSTAAPSAMASPLGGPNTVAPMADFHLDLTAVGLSLTQSQVAKADECKQELHLQRWIEWYFSADSLCHDRYLRSRMDEHGWVHLDDIVRLARLRSVSASVSDVAAALKTSKLVEVSEDRLKLRANSPVLQAAFAPRHSVDSKDPLTPPIPGAAVYPDPAADESAESSDDLSVTACVDPDEELTDPSIEGASDDLSVMACADPDEELTDPTINESSSTGRASKEGAPWPCVEWLTADPYVGEECLDWLISEPEPHEHAFPLQETKCRRQRDQQQYRKEVGYGTEYDSEYLEFGPESPSSAAWMRFEDDGYPTPGASLLGW